MNSWLLLTTGFILTTIISTFKVSTDTLKIKRCFNELPLSLIENAVNSIDEGIYYKASLDRERLESNVKTYLSKNLKGVISSYEISFVYYVYDSESHRYFLDMTDTPVNVDIHFHLKYLSAINLDYYRSFELTNLYDEREIN